ncbi:MAG: ATP-binding protein [Pseudomonadota bacterium]
MKRIRFGAFARLVAIFALVLLLAQLFLVWVYANDRAEGEQPGYRFPLPERVIAMADLIEAAEDVAPVLVALNGPDLRIDLSDQTVADMAPASLSLAAVDRVFAEYAARLQGREVAVFVSVPETVLPQDVRIGDRSIWTRYPIRIVLELKTGQSLIVETRDDLLTQVYSVPLGWWAGIFASVAALIVLFALHVETRPLTRLARAAERFGRDGVPRRVDPAGSQEAHALIANFNDMQTRIDDLLKRRGVMLGALGHDLRTHLTRLRLKLEAAAGTADHPDVSDDLAQMERVLESCLEIGRQTNSAELEVVELGGFAGAVLADYDPAAVSLSATGETFARVDPTALERILTNLLDNALRFGSRASVEVTPNPPMIVITDDGPGIAPAELDRVLQPFEVSNDARTQGQSGTGLGLTISKMLAEAQGATFLLRNAKCGGLRAELVLLPETGSG